MKTHFTHRLLVLLAIAACTLAGCDERLPRPFEPTSPHKSQAHGGVDFFNSAVRPRWLAG